MLHKILKTTITLLLISYNQAFSNNLEISNINLAGIDTLNNIIKVEFDISWDNSWRVSTAPNNWDAAWVFIKYRLNGGEWSHAKLSTSDSDHIAPDGSVIEATSDGMGVFIYKSMPGVGSNVWTNTILQWNYGENGVSDNSTNIEVKVLGLEMVYVPEAAFYAGDNGASVVCFRQGSTDFDPWYIGSEDALIVANSPGSGTGVGLTNEEYYIVSNNHIGEDTTGSEFLLPEPFPKGYDPFYCMKYEISQGQYADFLNMLTRDQQVSRVMGDISTDVITNIYVMTDSPTMEYQNTVICPANGNGVDAPILFSVISPDVACNFISWADGVAYSDWAGLRPMTELEFEKACRGPLPAVSGEFPWGTTTIVNSLYTINKLGSSDENIASNYSTIMGNASYRFTCSIDAPLRVGIFASNSGNTGRITSGASYYGVMEMGGNLRERIVSVGNVVGRGFTGLTGDGNLTESGDADVLFWPDNTAVGSGFKGGSWDYDASLMTISDRSRAGVTGTARSYSRTFRSVR